VSEPQDEFRDWPFQDFAAQLRGPGDAEELAEAFPWEAEDEAESEPDLELADELDEPDPLDVATVPRAPETDVEPEVEPEVDPEPEADVVEQHAGAEFRVPDGYEVLEGGPTGSRRTVGIVVSRFNAEITNQLLEHALETLEEAGVARDSVVIMPVPGAFELPLAAMALAKTRRYACIVALGCVIRGETSHFDFVAGEAASGLQLAAIETGVPISFGLLTCETREQAQARVERASDAARTALEMADLFSRLRVVAS
jgi:6,7-dimethyl-8-ribityllumazine synthase